jgi:hypothetical protein
MKLTAFVLCAALLGAAHAKPAPGTIAITDKAVDAKSKTFDKDLKKAQKTSLVKGSNGRWHIYFVASLTKAAGDAEVMFTFYENGERKDGYPIKASKDAKLIVDDLDVRDADLKAGKYEIRITRNVDGKEVVFARAKLELKDG